jgi:hypothetical protein
MAAGVDMVADDIVDSDDSSLSDDSEDEDELT